MAMGRNETAQWVTSSQGGGVGHPETLLDSLQEVFEALWRRRLWIAVSVLAALMLALTFLIFTNPLYSSTAHILIEPRAKQLLQTEVVPSGLGTSSVGPDTLLVDSQVEIMLSDAVLNRVVDQAGLAADPEFARPRGGGLSALLVGAGRIPARAGGQPVRLDQTPEAAALENLRKRLRVRRLGNTYLIAITVRSESPAMAKRLADAVAEGYLEDTQEANRDSTRQTTVMLASRLDELREDVRRAESRVEAFREEHGLIGAQDLLINEQQLRDLNDRLTEARTRSSETRVKY
jgi:polysaccharide biosynthesis transport protein